MRAIGRGSFRNSLRAISQNVDNAKVVVRRALDGGLPMTKLMLVSDGLSSCSEEQFSPFSRNTAALGRHLGVVATQKSVAKALKLPASSFASVDILGLKLSFLTPAAEARRITAHFRALLSETRTKLVYFDGDDDLCIQWPEVLGAVDCYVKKHVFSDLASYEQAFIGKSNLTDYVARTSGTSFESNVIPHCAPVDRSLLSNLQLGWNIGLDDKIAKLAATLPRVDQSQKTIDVVSRAYVKPDVWTYPLRAPAVEHLETMADKFRVLAPRDRVSQEQYYDEMLKARICVSPFGYGELCWRDFEAILCGCLVVKADMSHVRTYPDVFIPHETYAPVKWDYSNLEEVCARYLDDEEGRRRIAERAYATLMDALDERSFVELVRTLLVRLKLPVPASALRS